MEDTLGIRLMKQWLNHAHNGPFQLIDNVILDNSDGILHLPISTTLSSTQ